MVAAAEKRPLRKGSKLIETVSAEEILLKVLLRSVSICNLFKKG